MFSNTGELSLYLGIAFFVIALLGILAIFMIFKYKILEREETDKIIQLLQWFVVSVGIVFSAAIINDSFKERDQDIKDFAIFEKYAPNILKADDGEERRKITVFFAAVSPQGPIRNAWIKYKEDVIDKEETNFNAATSLIKQFDEISKKRALTVAELEKKGQAIAMITSYKQSLIPNDDSNKKGETSNNASTAPEKSNTSSQTQPNPATPSPPLTPRIYFHITNEGQRAKLKSDADKLNNTKKVKVPGVQLIIASPNQTELRFFKANEEDKAKEINAMLSELGISAELTYIPGYELSTAMRPYHFELWMGKNS